MCPKGSVGFIDCAQRSKTNHTTTNFGSVVDYYHSRSKIGAVDDDFISTKDDRTLIVTSHCTRAGIELT
jgi:hypothetical protein